MAGQADNILMQSLAKTTEGKNTLAANIRP
jgi:hypothetical protein